MARRKRLARTAHKPHCIPVAALPRLESDPPPFARWRRVRAPRDPSCSRFSDASFESLAPLPPFLLAPPPIIFVSSEYLTDLVLDLQFPDFLLPHRPPIFISSFTHSSCCLSIPSAVSRQHFSSTIDATAGFPLSLLIRRSTLPFYFRSELSSEFAPYFSHRYVFILRDLKRRTYFTSCFIEPHDQQHLDALLSDHWSRACQSFSTLSRIWCNARAPIHLTLPRAPANTRAHVHQFYILFLLFLLYRCLLVALGLRPVRLARHERLFFRKITLPVLVFYDEIVEWSSISE